MIPYLSLAIENLRHRKKRAYLTIIGVFIGIGTDATPMADGDPARRGRPLRGLRSGPMRYRRMPIEVESPEQLGYDRIRNNLAESSVADQALGVLGLAQESGRDPLRSDQLPLFASLVEQATLVLERLRLEHEMRDVDAVRRAIRENRPRWRRTAC